VSSAQVLSASQILFTEKPDLSNQLQSRREMSSERESTLLVIAALDALITWFCFQVLLPNPELESDDSGIHVPAGRSTRGEEMRPE